MKKITSEEIEGTRAYFVSQGFEEVKVILGNRTFSYFVLPQRLEPDLPDFVFRSTGDDPARYVFGISDSVNHEFRQYAVAHEFIEFTEIGIDVPNRCVKALEEELKLVPNSVMEEYTQMRRRFFRNLIDYCSKRPQQYNDSDLNEFKQTLKKLEAIVNKLS